MPKTFRRWIVPGALLLAAIVAIPALIWASLTHQPTFYKSVVTVPKAEARVQARRFVAQSMQLRNDICNEPEWEAVFTDQEVNAWLAEDLITHFADQLPRDVHDPRIVFEADRVTLAFGLDQGPIRSVIWVVARARVPEPNVLELTLEKIRAGVIPLASARIVDRISSQAIRHGLDIRWDQAGEAPVARIRCVPDPDRSDIVLEQLQIQKGQIRLAGRSDGIRGVFLGPVLPSRKVLQTTFPRRNVQRSRDPGSLSPSTSLHKSTTPTI